MRYFYIIALFLILFCMDQGVKAQQVVTVKGAVIDAEDKEPVAGVVILAGNPAKTAGVTDANGKFIVKVAANKVLTFKSVGYKDFSVKATGQQNLQISLNRETSLLKQVTIQGYVEKSREVSVGSSVVVTSKEIQDVPVANVMELLQGKVPGLNIQNNTGAPGFRGSIAVRGLSNINIDNSGGEAYLTPTAPLFVVDGIPIDDNDDYSYGFQQAGPGINPVSLIPQEDIESLEVLKDAAATALYGSRGAYGVILITTKRGNSKKPILRYKSNFFMKTVPQLRPVLGGKQERLFKLNQALNNDSSYYYALNNIHNTPFLADSLNPYYNNSTDWQSYFYKTTYNQTHNLDVSGGDHTFNYKVNLGWYNENGIQKNTGFSRYSMNMNMQYQPNSKFKMFAALNSQLGKQQKGSGSGLLNTGVAKGGSSSTLLPSPSLFSTVNSVLAAVNTENDNQTININSTVELQYQIVRGLRLTTNFNYGFNTGTEDTFRPGAINNNKPELYSYADRRTKLYNRNLLAYNYSINNAHNFSAYTFTEINRSFFKADALKSENAANDYIRGPDVSVVNGRFLGGTLNNFNEARSVALAGNFSYNYKQKYVLDASYRVDGNSTTGPLAGYTKNPSLGLRWNFNKENLLVDKKWMDYGSLRLTYGSNIVPNGNIYSVYGKYQQGGKYNGEPTASISLDRQPNDNLQPTKNTTLNAGLDIGLFKGRLNVTYETYYKQVDQILRDKEIPSINAFNKISTNETSLVDYGHEFSLRGNPLNPKGKVKWTASVNAAINRDVLAQLPDGHRQIIFKEAGQWVLYRLGLNSLTNFIYNTKGVYASDNDVPVDPLTGLRYSAASNDPSELNYFRAGDPIFTDLNGDYILDEKDIVEAGNSQPIVTGGVSNFVQYKGWSLNVNCSFTFDRDILNNALSSQLDNYNNPYSLGNISPFEQYDYWKADGDEALYPNPFDFRRSGIIKPFRFDQTLFQEDGSYFKINTITLSYTLDREWLKKTWGFNGIRIYTSANNVATFSRYSGPNPENVTALGRDASSGYPVPRSFILGLNVEF